MGCGFKSGDTDEDTRSGEDIWAVGDMAEDIWVALLSCAGIRMRIWGCDLLP